MNKQEAYRALSDELFVIEKNIKNAGYLIQDLLEGYFGNYSPNTIEEDKFRVLWDFNRNASRADLLNDCINNISAVSKELAEINAKSALQHTVGSKL